jgi:low temperature requirement protein LtrA
MSGEERRTGFIELFFDLVFVFAVAELASFIRHEHSVAGFGKAAVVFGLVWWCWSLYTWLGTLVDLGLTHNRLAMLAATVLVFVMALMVPGVFDDTGLGFALAYAAVRLMGSGFYWFGLAADAEGRAARASFVPSSMVSPALVIVGGLMPSTPRLAVWCVALAVDVWSAVHAGRAEFRVSPAHFAERHGLFVIIALGEIIVATGMAVAGEEDVAGLIVPSVVVAVAAVVLWWSYFDWVHPAAERRLGSSAGLERGRVARDLFTFLHFPIVAGVVGFAVAAEEIALHPSEPLGTVGAVGLAGGIGLFMLGFVIGNRRATGSILVERFVAVATVVGIVTVLRASTGLLVLSAVVVLLAAALGVERVRRRTVAA